MEEEIVVISVSPEVSEVLSENGVDLFAALADKKLDVRLPSDPILFPEKSDRTKSVALIILASAAASPLIASAIVQILDGVSRFKTKVSAEPGNLPQSSTTRSLKAKFLGLNVEFSETRKDV